MFWLSNICKRDRNDNWKKLEEMCFVKIMTGREVKWDRHIIIDSFSMQIGQVKHEMVCNFINRSCTFRTCGSFCGGYPQEVQEVSWSYLCPSTRQSRQSERWHLQLSSGSSAKRFLRSSLLACIRTPSQAQYQLSVDIQESVNASKQTIFYYLLRVKTFVAIASPSSKMKKQFPLSPWTVWRLVY